MSTSRVYLAPERWRRESPELDATDAHHCADVLRLGAGDKVIIFDGEGHEAAADLLEVSRKQTLLSIGHRVETPKPRRAITLAQAVPKGKNMDLVIQKAVELGASTIIPLLSERTVVKIEDAEDAARKQERWQSIAIEACKQSGQNRMPLIGLPRTTKDFFRAPPEVDMILIASLQPDSQPIKQTLSSYEAAQGALPESVVILIGPEGDFTPAETEAALSAGAQAITLGPIILRTETAAIYCLSVLGHELF